MLPAQTEAAPLASNTTWDGKAASVFFLSFPSAFYSVEVGGVLVCVLERERVKCPCIFLLDLNVGYPKRTHAAPGKTKTAESEVREGSCRAAAGHEHAYMCTRTHTDTRTVQMSTNAPCAQLFSNIENLQNIEFGISVRSPRLSIIQNKKYKKDNLGSPPPSPVASHLLVSLTRIQLV